MAIYSGDFKLKVVKEYLEGSMGCGLLANKYGVPNKERIQRWVNAYKTLDEAGLRRELSKTDSPVQFKLDVLNFIRQTGTSYE
ncbi:helix-turn-helix domain-containing protein [Salibacterium aidingense]|uniref:helix-turn-helix domain-containing protein n=1 Tax=Salibacterium aidingense TaxID=384933 RepID=UPI003BE3FA30